MKSPWSSPLSLLTVIAAFPSFIAVAADAQASRELMADLYPTAAMLTYAAAALELSDPWLQLNSWISEGFHRAPALMLGLAMLALVPPLAVAGLLMRGQRRSPDSTVLISRPRRQKSGDSPVLATARTEISAWPTEAWVEDSAKRRYIVGRTMLRIGREADNDICLTAKTVHRYHAVIRRTTDGEVLITDLSGSDGNGVLVNGARATEARLTQGDVINIGEVKMRFDARPV